ncbi:MAG TPA: D-alanyl-D-alanine carboxypeptidase family protein [Rickettsiales bacterium]|nr:D-alanyl-D-alanine carboxypeptidase family protein [Rickettsiales bacterium]
MARFAKNHVFVVASFLAALSISFAAPQSAYASSKHHHHHHHKKAYHAVYKAPHVATIVVDADSNQVLESESADALHYPASLTKMMTLYLTFDALKHNKLSLDQDIIVSRHAAGMPATNIALSPGEHLKVKDAILSIVVNSANDSATALGETIGGTESDFAQKMTRKAAELGMKNTVFQNASGLPNPRQHTTARDMAMLGLALKRDFPQYFPFFKTESFTFRGNTYVTHNHVMMRYAGVDGIKTGFIRASGFNLVTSVNRDGHHLVAVVLGGSTWRSRDDRMIALLDRTFNHLAMLPGSNRVRLSSAIRNHQAQPAFAEEQQQQQPVTNGEGDESER